MKGQLLIIAAILLVVGIISFKMLLGNTQELSVQESNFLDKQLNNVMAEYKYIMGTAKSNATGISSLANFSNYLRNEHDVRMLYIFVWSNNSVYSVTIGNFLKDKINVTLNATDSAPSSAVSLLQDKLNRTFDFASAAQNVNITLSYRMQGSNTTQTVEKFKADANSTSGFIDIIFENSDMMVRGKDVV